MRAILVCLSLGFRGYRLRKEEVFARLVHDSLDMRLKSSREALKQLV